MTNVQSTAPHARNQKSYAHDNNSPFKKVGRTKHGHATYHKIPMISRGLEFNSVILKRPTHSLTAYNFFFKHAISKLLRSASITDNDSVAAFPSPQKFLVLSIFPDRIELIRRSG